MKTRIKLTYSLICIIGILWSSCVDDKGNYSYKDVSYPIYSTVYEDVNLETYTPVLVEPEVEFSEGIGFNDYTFDWLWNDNKTPGGVLFSTSTETPTLSLDRLPDFLNKPGSYTVLLRMTNNQTKSIYTKQHTFKVTNPIQTGYLALSQKTGRLELDLISPAIYASTNKELTFVPNLLDHLESAYPKEGRTPIDLCTFGDNLAPDPTDTDAGRVKYSVYILTDKGTDRLRTENYSYESRYNIRNISFMPEKYRPSELIADKISSNFDSQVYAYMGGNWYFYITYATGSAFLSYPINRYKSEEETFPAAPYIVSCSNGSSGSAVIYNKAAKRFTSQVYISNDISSNLDNIMSSANIEDGNDDAFKFNDPNYELIYMNNKCYPRSNGVDAFIIVQNKSTLNYEIWLFTIDTKGVITNKMKRDIPSNVDMANIKYYSADPIEPILVMATEDKIYSVLYSSTNTNMDIRDLTSSVVPQNHKISCLKHMGAKRIGTNPLRQVLGVATYDPSISLDICGTVQFFEIDSYNASFSLAKYPKEPSADVQQRDMKWEGFGKVIALDSKIQ